MEATTQFRDDHSGDEAALKQLEPGMDAENLETLAALIRTLGMVAVIVGGSMFWGAGGAWCLMELARRREKRTFTAAVHEAETQIGVDR